MNGGSKYRLEVRPRHLLIAFVLVALAAAAFAADYVRKLHYAEASVGTLRALTAAQQARLHEFDAKTSKLSGELQHLQVQNEEIKRLFVGRGKTQPPAGRTHALVKRPARVARDFGDVAERIAKLSYASARVAREDDRLRRIAFRVLNVRQLQDLARARVLAEIPSLNPAGAGVAIRSPYGWRVDPWPEFHAGVDLDVDYGDPVRASAAGTVVAAGFDGDYGIKIDIDHGNGYHTWYCHLSRTDVEAGEYVAKGEHIAEVGSTGESTGPHLHYQIMLAGHAVDPLPYLTGVPNRVLASLR